MDPDLPRLDTWIFQKRGDGAEGGLDIRPQLYPKCFMMALALAKTVAPSWNNLTTKIVLDPASDPTVKALAAATIVPTPGPKLTEIGEDGDEF